MHLNVQKSTHTHEGHLYMNFMWRQHDKISVTIWRWVWAFDSLYMFFLSLHRFSCLRRDVHFLWCDSDECKTRYIHWYSYVSETVRDTCLKVLWAMTVETFHKIESKVQWYTPACDAKMHANFFRLCSFASWLRLCSFASCMIHKDFDVFSYNFLLKWNLDHRVFIRIISWVFYPIE